MYCRLAKFREFFFTCSLEIGLPFLIPDALEAVQIPVIIALDQGADLIEQSALQHDIHPLIDTGIQVRSVHRQPDHEHIIQRLMRLPLFDGAFGFAVMDDAQCADDPFPVVRMDLFARLRIHDLQCTVQLLLAQRIQKAQIVFIRLFLGERIIIERGLDVQAGAAAQDRHAPFIQDLLQAFPASFLKHFYIIFFMVIQLIDQMMRDALHLFLRHFGAADIQTAVHLDGISADDFSLQASCQFHAERGLAHAGRADDDDHLILLLSHVRTPCAAARRSCTRWSAGRADSETAAHIDSDHR